MKYTIFGVNQEKLIKLNLKIKDAFIISKLNDLFLSQKTTTIQIEDKKFYLIVVDDIIKKYPILRLNKNSLLSRIGKLVKKGVLEKKHENTTIGSFAYYRGKKLFHEMFFTLSNTTSLTFKEQYEHPLWQRKRLEVMARDDFKCKECGNNKILLNVHHKWYSSDKMVWEYDNNCYVTLCKKCHTNFHLNNKKV